MKRWLNSLFLIAYAYECGIPFGDLARGAGLTPRGLRHILWRGIDSLEDVYSFVSAAEVLKAAEACDEIEGG